MLVRTGICMALLVLMSVPQSEAGSEVVYGPARYEVIERYGRTNEYTVSVPASDTVYLVKLQNGDARSSRTDYLAFSVNGRTVVLDGAYSFPFIACFVRLEKENVFHLSLRDERPSGFRRPPLVPKSVTITVVPVPAGMGSLRGSFGLMKWDDLKDVAKAFQDFKSSAAAVLAMDSYSLHLGRDERVAAVRSLANARDPSAEVFLVAIYGSLVAPSEVRAEAALAIAHQDNPERIPLLMRGVVDPSEKIRIACARGLALFPEEQTGKHLVSVLTQLDKFRRKPVIDSIAASGWRPYSTLEPMANDKDPAVAEIAIDLFGKFREPRSTDLLLAMLSQPDPRKVNVVIMALGETMDPRAIDALLALAADPLQRTGKAVSLADALANLGDQRAAPLIGEMIRSAKLSPVENRLRRAYWRLTGKTY